MKTSAKVWLAAGLYWVLASVLSGWLYPLTISDACTRYAPMADAFACGDFYYAFHPRVGPLFGTLAGGLSYLTGLKGDFSVQVSAFLLLALTAVVMFAFAKRLNATDEAAWWTFALVLLVPDYFVYALDGLRETGKCLVFALVAYSVVAKRSWSFALALFLYTTLVTYGFAVSCAFVALWCAWFAIRREWSQIPLPVGGWILGTLTVTALTHAYTGHWLPASQYINLLGAWL